MAIHMGIHPRTYTRTTKVRMYLGAEKKNRAMGSKRLRDFYMEWHSKAAQRVAFKQKSEMTRRSLT